MTRPVRNRIFAGLYACLVAITAITVVWSMRQGWAGRTVHGPVGQGILVGTLGTLAMHFGLTPRAQAA